MPLHLQKLCVGAESIDDLQGWLAERLADKRRRGLPVEQVHVTRMTPKRVEEILDGGALYWVIKGVILVRQNILELRALKDAGGVSRCGIVLQPELVRVTPQPRRPFQGWRYLAAADAPKDLAEMAGAEDLPPEVMRELRDLGLW
jgi:hypothetical protein